MIKNFLALFGACCAALVVGAYIRNADASRNSAGSYSLPAGNPVVPGTITRTWANGTMSDLATELTNSLDRQGRGGMLASLRGVDGTVTAPAYSFTSETGTGFYRIGASDLGLALAGSKIGEWTATNTLWAGGTPMLLGRNVIAGFATLHAGTTAVGTPSSSNYFIGADGTATTSVNAPTTVNLNVAASTVAKATSAGFTIGASGTAISGSFRGTASLTPGSIAAQSCIGAGFVTVTGASVGSECVIGPPGGAGTFTYNCGIASLGSCGITICNPTTGALTAPAGTYACRVFNP